MGENACANGKSNGEVWSRGHGLRPRVTTIAAAVVAETVKDHSLTPDEVHRLKTRLQYRMYQRNHRAKRLYQQSYLQTHNRKLEEEIAALTIRVQPMERTLMTAALDAYTYAFRFSLRHETVTQEAQIRRCFSPVHETVNNAVSQWHQLCQVCSEWKMEWNRESTSILRYDEGHLFVSVQLILHLRGTWSTVDETRVLPSNGLEIRGRAVFDITMDQLITWYTMDFDSLDFNTSIANDSLDLTVRLWIHQWAQQKSVCVGFAQSVARTSVDPQHIDTIPVKLQSDKQEDNRRKQSRLIVPSNQRHSVNYLLS